MCAHNPLEVPPKPLYSILDKDMSNIVIDRLAEQIRSKDVALDGQERPCAILWTDPTGEWMPVVVAMQAKVEELLILGNFSPERRSGPAIWLRCLIDGTLDQPTIPESRIPIVYLPEVSRQDLRAGENCPAALRPLVELMYRGTLWLQDGGRDWGVTTFLRSKSTLGLDIAKDTATEEALIRALAEIALTPIQQLQGRRLEADDFDRMLSADVIRDLLRWMGDPDSMKQRLGENGWGAFCSQCREQLDFDPDAEATVTAGERMGEGQGSWAEVWSRFAESPGAFGGITELLRRCRPGGAIPFNRDRWPDLNDEDEEALLKKLDEIGGVPHVEARLAVAELEEQHGMRRVWTWAKLGQSPMAMAIEPLSRLAEATETAIGGTTADEAAAAYIERGWLADAAAWEAISVAPLAAEKQIQAVVRLLLHSWLEDSATAFQKALGYSPLPGSGNQPLVQAKKDGCLLFADGLRYDLGRRLSERLESRGCRVTLNHRWAAVPTVTATAKPAVTPVADSIGGETLSESFYPIMKSSGKLANAQVVRDSMKSAGYQILGDGVMNFPATGDARGWTEAGKIDELGHKLKVRMAGQIDEELNRLANRILALLDAGWQSVRVVTDHGWLLLPGGLPKVDLPKHLTASRWARCAVIAGESTPDVMRSPWHWNSRESFATAPGIACFNKSEEYAHGGLSLQECLIPDLLVEHSDEVVVKASIITIVWRGMRCFIEATTSDGGVVADLRLERPNGASVVTAAKKLDDDGTTSLVLADDEHENEPLVLVLLDSDGNILAKKPTRVGEVS